MGGCRSGGRFEWWGVVGGGWRGSLEAMLVEREGREVVEEGWAESLNSFYKSVT